MLAIVAPMATEIAGVRRAILDPQGKRVMTLVTGVGRQRTEASVTALAARSPDAILMIGFCGGADPELVTGDLHVAGVFLSAERIEPIAADPGLANRLEAWADGHETRVVYGPSVTVGAVASSKVKSALHAATGAMTVNMEDYWAASTAANCGIPFASLRAVLDTAGDELPDYLGDAGDGIVNVLGGVVRHPGRVPGLVRLASKARVARDRLADCVAGLLEAPPVLPAGMGPLIR